MINVKNHHTDAAIRMDAAFASISEPLSVNEMSIYLYEKNYKRASL